MKKDLDYYMSLPYEVVIKPDLVDGGYVAHFPDLPGCITQADTWEELQFMIEDAKKCWLEAALEDLDSIPEPQEMNKFKYNDEVRVISRGYKGRIEGCQMRENGMSYLVEFYGDEVRNEVPSGIGFVMEDDLEHLEE